jgi:4'-phosphopantetheinyl transferase
MTAVVHAWWAAPDHASTTTGWLDATELHRLARLTRAEDRDRFVTSRAILKTLVGSLTGLPPADVSLRYDCDGCGQPHGRPVLVGPAAREGWQVSLSHAGDRVLVAAAQGWPVGVDVEPVAAAQFSGFADVALAPAELRDIEARPAPDRPRAMAQAWVAKESFLKATGTGLRVDPRLVDTGSLEPGWSVVDLDLGPDYVAAVAMPTPELRLAVRHVTTGSAGRAAPPSTATAGTAR